LPGKEGDSAKATVESQVVCSRGRGPGFPRESGIGLFARGKSCAVRNQQEGWQAGGGGEEKQSARPSDEVVSNSLAKTEETELFST